MIPTMTSRRWLILSTVVLLTASCTSGDGATTTSQAGPTSTSIVSPPSSSTAMSPASSFDACVGSFHGLCKNRAQYLAGDRPEIVAVIQPHPSEDRAMLWRRAPGGSWAQIASVKINGEGRMRWQLETSDADVHDAAWSFQYRVPGRGESDVVRVEILTPDF
jgi:hypothetical protein